MASKNLTHIFIVMRDKSIQRRNLYRIDEEYSDHDALVLNEEGGRSYRPGLVHLPSWCFQVDEVKQHITVLKDKTKCLVTLQSNLIRCPSFDNSEEEREMAILTNEIRRSLERCQILMLEIENEKGHGRVSVLNKNVVSSLANGLQDVKNDFVKACSSYTSSITNFKKTSSFIHDGGGEYDGDYGTFDDSGSSHQAKAWAHEQLLFLEDNTAQIDERDKAVQNILKSTIELNQLFKDVAHLVHEQGTIVDRIDCNIGHAATKVEGGVHQLRKAEHYQRKNKNMVCIVGLAGAIIFLIMLLVIVKT